MALPLPFGLAPVVAYQVGRDHIEVALRAVHPGPPGQQPDERLGRDLVRGVVVVDQPPDPAGQLGVDAFEQLFDGVRVDPLNLASGAHRISLDEVPGRWERRGLASRSPARHEDHVGAGRGVLENTRVIRQLLPHSCPGEAARRSLLVAYGSAGFPAGLSCWSVLLALPGAFPRRLARARPRDVRAPLRARPSPGLALLRDDKTRSSVAQKLLFFRTGRGVRPRPAPRASRVRRSPVPRPPYARSPLPPVHSN